jgi:hypothetical protein
MAAKYNNSEMQRPGKTMAGKNNGWEKQWPRKTTSLGWGIQPSPAELRLEASTPGASGENPFPTRLPSYAR